MSIHRTRHQARDDPDTGKTRSPVGQVESPLFLSPLRQVPSGGWVFSLLSKGGEMPLVYATKQQAKAARKDLLKGTNAHSVPGIKLYGAIRKWLPQE
jgi:hypothetical protein